jgi:hypothetical protein
MISPGNLQLLKYASVVNKLILIERWLGNACQVKYRLEHLIANRMLELVSSNLRSLGRELHSYFLSKSFE